MRPMIERALSRTLTIPQHRVAVRSLPAQDGERAIATLTRAFESDPPTRHLFPDPQAYFEAFPRFARAFGGAAFSSGFVDAAAGGRAVALWLRPGTGPDEQAVADVVERFTPAPIRAEAFELFERMGRLHPEEPHWYLPLIGVDPAAQGHGLGSALLSHALRRIDDLGLPAYLEATSPRNVPLYQFHGFETVEVIRAGACPPVTAMLRPPQ
jgi:GNAT superfamily N-acetyltransferase